MNYGPQINVAPEWLINSLTAPAGGGGAKTSKVAPKKGDDGEGKGGDSEETDKKSGPKGGAGGEFRLIDFPIYILRREGAVR